MANNTYSTPVINNFDAIKGDTNSPDTLSTEIKHGIQSPLLSTAQCYEELKSNSSWMEAVCMNTRLCGYKDFAPPDFYDYLEKFFMKLQNEGETVKSPQDAKSHFARWLKIELEKKKKDEITRKDRRINSYTIAKTDGGSSITPPESFEF